MTTKDLLVERKVFHKFSHCSKMGQSWSDRPSHAFTRNLGSTQQTTCTMSCLVSCLVDLYNSLICAHKNEYYELYGNNNSYNGCGVVS
jgi:hypothetical protein